MKLLVLCPSRGRPNLAKKMFDSFEATKSKSTKLVFLLDVDDDIDSYPDCDRVINDRGLSVTAFINDAYAFYKDLGYTHYSVTNDDFIYHTFEWDRILINSIPNGGIAYGNDLLAGEGLPTTSVISADIVDHLGWLQLPNLLHMCGDTVWRHIGQNTNTLKYNKNVIIEHCHASIGKSPKDATHERTSDPVSHRQDFNTYQLWKSNEAPNQIKSLNERLSHGH